MGQILIFADNQIIMVKYTKHYLKKLEGLFEELKYTIRYEKGNFNSGYCIVQNKKIIIVNKFFDTEGRINCLLDVFQNTKIDPNGLSEKNVKFFQELSGDSDKKKGG